MKTIKTLILISMVVFGGQALAQQVDDETCPGKVDDSRNSAAKVNVCKSPSVVETIDGTKYCVSTDGSGNKKRAVLEQ